MQCSFLFQYTPPQGICSKDFVTKFSDFFRYDEHVAPMLYFAQCVMCFRNAAAQQAARSHVLNQGIVVLLIPPLLILFGLLWMARRRSTALPVKPPDPPSDR